MITSGQQLFINRALPILRRDPRVVGVALGGSYIEKEKMDEFSGLDFVVAVQTESLQDVLQNMEEIAGKIGPLLACFPGEHIQRPNLLICLFDDPIIHVDFNFVAADDASGREDEPIILFEKNNILTEQYALKPPATPAANMQWCEDRFWIWVHYAATRIGRGDLFDAIESLAFLRTNVLGPLVQIKNGAVPNGVRNIERDSPNDVPRLIATLAEYDRRDCIRALKAATDLYIALRGINKSHMYLREKAESRALRYLNYISEKFS
ncbi:MAG: aminoglycoside 6-adenylyltransferase [Oscillospiraceae bacterium]|jgi:hypothetical protein|nr:aminoglycoside 6-adenylyltransferase [Oscillospiraceae bacterium]